MSQTLYKPLRDYGVVKFILYNAATHMPRSQAMDTSRVSLLYLKKNLL